MVFKISPVLNLKINLEMVDKVADIALSQEYIEFEQKHNRHLNMLQENVIIYR